MLSHILAQMNATIQPDDEPFTLDDARQHVNDYNAWIDGQLEPDFDSMSIVDYLKWQEQQRPGTLDTLWQATVKDAENVLKYAWPDTDSQLIHNAKRILRANGGHTL